MNIALRVAGMVLLALGVLCLPVGFGVSPKRDLSLFNNLADVGAFFKAALVLIPLGLLSLAASYVMKDEERH